MSGVRVLQGALISLNVPPYNLDEMVLGGCFFQTVKTVRKEDSIVAKKESKKSNRPETQQESTRLNVIKFLQETKEELNKVVWPSRKQLISESAAVMLMVTLVATLIYLFDNLFQFIAGQIF